MPVRSLAWNSRSVKNKLSQLSQFLDHNEVDLIFLSETWLKENDIFYLPFYDCYRSDREYGGVAILIRKTIPHVFYSKICLPAAEAVSIKIKDSHGEFTASAIYCSPNNSRSNAKAFFDQVLSIPGPHVVAGDFNAKHTAWNNTCNCRKGQDLLKTCEDRLFDIHAPDDPTVIPTNSHKLSVLDFAISKRIPGISDPLVHNSLGSDHFPITFEIPFNSTFPKAIEVFNWCKADWKKFKSKTEADSAALLNSFTSLSTPSEIDEAVDNFDNMVLDAIDFAVPKKLPFKHRYRYSDHLNRLTRERNHYRNLYKRTLDPTSKSLFNQLNRLISSETSKLSQEVFNEKLTTLEVRNNSLWQFTKSLKNKKHTVPPLKDGPGSVAAFSDKEKADALAQGFHESHLVTSNRSSFMMLALNHQLKR
jgi:endonuclease/exonuclease/phosphatase family metal-dependent hydrolase